MDTTNQEYNIHLAPESVVKVPKCTPSSPADNTARDACLTHFGVVPYTAYGGVAGHYVYDIDMIYFLRTT